MADRNYGDKSIPLDKRLSSLEAGLAYAQNDPAADLVREARDAIEEARRLINVAFGEYACAARAVLPEIEKTRFESNFGRPARVFLYGSPADDRPMAAKQAFTPSGVFLGTD